MPNTASLKAAIRREQGKSAARKLRAAGRVPAVVYGHGEQTRMLFVDSHELERLFARITVENTIIQLDVEGEGSVPVLVREVQNHPYLLGYLHVDFYQVHAGERVTVEVPVRLAGTAEGVRRGGVLDHILHNVEIRCTPDRIPEVLEVDVRALGIGDSLHVRDLAAPTGVEIVTDGERTICSVVAPTVAALGETAEVPAGPGGEVKPELIRRRQAETE